MTDDTGKRYTFTRGELTAALLRISFRVPVQGAMSGNVNAEDMTDAIIAALTRKDPTC